MLSSPTTPRRLALWAAVLGLASYASAQASRPYRVIDLGVPIGQSPMAGVGASGMSANADHVVGFSVWEPFVWRRGAGMQPLQKLPGYVSAGAIGVTDTGLAVGRCGLDTGPWETYQAVWWDQAGVVTSLSQPGWAYSIAIDVNAGGQVLVSVGVPVGSGTETRAFLGPIGGPLVQLVPGAGLSIPYDINDEGQVCLTSVGLGEVRYTPGIGLQQLPMRGRKLNEYGQVAGFDAIEQFVARYTDGRAVHVFATLGTFYSVGGIDSFGQIVATHRIRTSVSPPRYAEYGYLISDDLGARRLETLVDHPVPVRVGEVVGISDRGVIAASGSIGPDNRAMLLEPRFLHVYGRGCAGSNGVVKSVAAGDAVGGGRLSFLAAGGRRGGVGSFALSGRAATIPLPGGCTLAVDPTAAVLIGVGLDTIGQGRLALTLPPAVPAGSVFVQFVSVDPTMPLGIATSNGVRVDLQ